MTRWPCLAANLLLLAGLASAARAGQDEDRDPDDGFFRTRLLYSGEVVVNVAPEDRGYFNETDYGRDSLRLFRVNFALELRATDSLSILTEIRSDQLDVPKPYALYLRLRPWRSRAFDIQAGLVPPVFGKYSRRRYEYDNPLIGYPLPYQYPSTLRSDAAPASLEQFLAYRGYGAVTRYPIGDRSVTAGLAQMNPLRWDTGVQVKVGDDPVEVALAVTQGTLGNPLVRDDNRGKQIAARLGFRPSFGSELGLSASSGKYVADELETALEAAGALNSTSSRQTSVGLDGEAARGSWILRAEGIWTRWDVPYLETGPLSVLGFMVELRYKVIAGLHVATRISGSRFSTIESEGGPVTWDAPVTRVETGVGYAFRRRILGKFSLQYNERDGGRIRTRWIPAAQLLFWF